MHKTQALYALHIEMKILLIQYKSLYLSKFYENWWTGQINNHIKGNDNN